MKSAVLLPLLGLIVAASLGGGYWVGRHADDIKQHVGMGMGAVAPAAAEAPKRQPSYYQHPSGEPDYSPEPKKTEDGRDYVPVYEPEEQASAGPAKTEGQGKPLYYRNPMGLPDTSPVPKKDSMGMEYIPVYENEAEDGGTVKISPAKIQRLGVRTEPARMRDLTRTIGAVGTIAIDERRVSIVTSKFDGFIEALHVSTTGQPVKRGQPLMEIYSPELVAAQQEYLVAVQAQHAMHGASDEVRGSAGRLVEGALQRLRSWDVSEDQIQRLRRENVATRRLTLRAPGNGLVLDKAVVSGQRIMAGEMLYRIADLSSVWLIAEVFEQDLGAVREGQVARIKVNAYPEADFAGKIDFIYPTVSRDTRTAKVRLVVPNPDARLKADMYASVEIAAAKGGSSLAVPESAVLNSGSRTAVLVDKGEGRFEPREVRLGALADGYYAVMEGLKPDEQVVVSANFLIDAESNLRAALKSFVPADDQGSRQ